MTTQQNLFGAPNAYGAAEPAPRAAAGDPLTSHEAALRAIEVAMQLLRAEGGTYAMMQGVAILCGGRPGQRRRFNPPSVCVKQFSEAGGAHAAT